MNLLDEMFEPFEILNKNKVSDGEGGYIVEWTTGATINAVAVLDSSMQSKIAEVQGVTSVYTITTRKDVVLEYHEVIRRKRDGKVFRVTSDANDKLSPNVSSLDIAQVNAEKWSLT